MYDLFISYSSLDRPWAEKLYTDLKEKYPTLRVFWDRAAIPAAGQWRTILTAGNVNTAHLAFFWSDNAKGSREVEPEISTFEADVRYRQWDAVAQRLTFPFQLQGARGGSTPAIQGFPALAQYYDPTAKDSGVSKLASEPGLSEWNRAVKMVGDAILSVDRYQPIIAAIVATTTARLELVDSIRGFPQTPTGPTLDEFLKPFGLRWEDVRPRYGRTALDWHPFGAAATIVDLLDDLRVQANSRLEPKYWFRWDPVDLADRATHAESIQRLRQEPSVVIIDPISLYDYVSANAFRKLADYARDEQSIIISLAPVGQTGVDWLARALREQSVPLLDDYFEPKIPPLSRFASCAINVQRIDELERLVRSRLGYLHVRARAEQAKRFTGMGGEV
jgi:hypothetical protein